MKNENIYVCRIKDESPIPAAVAELLFLLDPKLSSFADREKSSTLFHIFYAENKSQAENIALKAEKLLQNAEFLDISDFSFEVIKIKKEDWSESWKKYFDIQKVSDRIIIQPSWLKYTPEQDEIVLQIDPGMSFGTGQHATSKFCLDAIDKISGKMDSEGRLLDAGCGSGILSIAAYKLGFKNISAFDIDPQAVEIARQNAKINAIPNAAVDFQTANIAEFEFSESFDFVLVNILSRVLTQNAEKIRTFLKKNAYLVLSGILTTEYCELCGIFTELGLEELWNCSEKEWTGGVFQLR